MNDAVITGLGAVTGSAASADALWEQLLTPGPVGAVAALGLSATDLAATALTEAITTSRLDAADLARCGLVVGTTLGDIECERDGEPVPGSRPYDVAVNLARRFRIAGPVHSVSTACSSGAYSLGLAVDLIACRDVERVLVCGADRRSVVSAAMLERLGMLDAHGCRPLDAARNGMVPGEGAAALVLESRDAAVRRTASVHAAVEAERWSSDAHHAVAPEPDGVRLRHAVDEVLRAAPAPPGAVIPHRAGVAENDRIETAVIAGALGDAARDTPVHAVKAFLGHTAGAAAVFACLVATLILRHRVVPPNRNVTVADPDCPLPIPLDGPTPLPRPRVLVTATGFGGSNAAVLLAGA